MQLENRRRKSRINGDLSNHGHHHALNCPAMHLLDEAKNWIRLPRSLSAGRAEIGIILLEPHLNQLCLKRNVIGRALGGSFLTHSTFRVMIL